MLPVVHHAAASTRARRVVHPPNVSAIYDIVVRLSISVSPSVFLSVLKDGDLPDRERLDGAIKLIGRNIETFFACVSRLNITSCHNAAYL